MGTITLDEVIKTTIRLRPATSKDFNRTVSVENNGSVDTKLLPKIGQPFWLKSEVTGEFDIINYQITENTDWTEFKEYLRRGMVYVPETFFDLTNKTS